MRLRLAALAALGLTAAAACENLTQPRTADGQPPQPPPQQPMTPPTGWPPPQPNWPPPQPTPQPTSPWIVPTPTQTAQQPPPDPCRGLALSACAAPACRQTKLYCYDRKRGCTYERALSCVGAGQAGPPALTCSVDPGTGDPCQSMEAETIPGGGACGSADQQTLAQSQSLLGCP